MNISKIHSCRVEVGLFYCKLDLEKTYDHANWDIFYYILDIMGFGAKWRSWIFYCIRTVKFSILINGWSVGFFRTSKGLRQGDPLSLLLFIMVSEVLSKMIKVERDFISGFLVGKGDCTISHLQFADDTMIFCDADENQVGYLDVLCVVLKQCRAFILIGIKVSFYKFRMCQILKA